MRVLVKVEYIGTNYQGWQRQVSAPSIEEKVEQVLSKILNEPIIIYGSGRTDAGVHAEGQHFHFDITKKVDVDLNLLKYSLNSLLPHDIRVISLKEVSDDFHARKCAKKKIYEYRIHFGECSVFDYPFCLEVKQGFDKELFNKALNLFIGTHDFKSFTSKEEDHDNFIRHIDDINHKKIDDIDVYTFIGPGFMRYMIRNLIGTAIACGSGKISLEEIKNLLSSDKRNIVSYKADAKGLFLVDVLY
ncbi:MAG: tRNA pseudouridine(38-40) synthase TruA [Erysipelotrichaceae bacterium]|jgi:tRNA pseudouridine38-40 synthase|nr:tRNA pseudouridine(38-40) synthase TruA [Erysipelotrichaceae bacterium]